MSPDPHASHWQAIASVAEAINISPSCGPEQAAEFCRAIDRLSAALMGEAEDSLVLLNWMQAHRAGLEWSDDLESPDVRVTLARRYGDRLRLDWHASLVSAIEHAKSKHTKQVST